MNAFVSNFLLDLIPPILLRYYRRHLRKTGFSGSYSRWEEASALSGGYDTDAILDHVRSALSKVRDKEWPYERDGVLFSQIQHSWPFLAFLLWAASQSENRLRVMDVGGSLGSSYFQNREFLAHLQEFSWSVVEQPNFVACGREEFSDGVLAFYGDLRECVLKERPNVVVLSSVLPYLEKPYEMLEDIISLTIPFLLLDRTPVFSGAADRLTVQRVPAEIYPASYPAWFFEKKKLLSVIGRHYDLITEFDALAGTIHLDGAVASDSGFIFRCRN